MSAVVGLGLAAVGRPGYLNLGHGDDLGPDRSVEALERRSHELLDAALAGGVRHFDAARSYGRAEEFLGSWLRGRGIAPGTLVVSSKWGYTYTAGWQVDADPPEVKDLSLATFRRQLEETRANLGDHLSLYQIHSATIESGVLEDAELMAALADLRASGVQVGLSATGATQSATIDRAVELAAFDSVQATWNVLEPSAGPALSRAREAGLRTMLKETLANGRLTARGGCEPLERLARDVGVAPDALALAAALAQPWADVVLSGAAAVEQLESNLAARALGIDDAVADELAAIAEPPERYWAERSALAWT